MGILPLDFLTSSFACQHIYNEFGGGGREAVNKQLCVRGINRSHIAVLRVEQTMALISRSIAPSYVATTFYPYRLTVKYQYTADLLALDRCRAPQPRHLPPLMASIVTPLPWREWQMRLVTHPDRNFANLVVTGIKEGFRIRYDYSSHTCKKSPKNMQSAKEGWAAINEYLAHWQRWTFGVHTGCSLFTQTIGGSWAIQFGLRSAPKIFMAVADALEWIVKCEGVSSVIHYLDDFLLAGPPGSLQCARDLNTLLSSFSRLGVPVATQKLEGPTMCLTFLGIEIDTMALQLHLPQAKQVELRALVSTWMGKRSA